MSSAKYKKTGWMRKRINTCAKELKIFTSSELQKKINSYSNQDGTRKTKHIVSIHQLSQNLKGNPNIKILYRSEPRVWKWIE